jgi:hypothetical protein
VAQVTDLHMDALLGDLSFVHCVNLGSLFNERSQIDRA